MNLMEDFQSIVNSQDSKFENIIDNLKNYEVLGKGAQGAVFKLSPDRCVKLYKNSTYARLEEKVLRAAAESRFFPIIYESGQNYIVMEYFGGPSLGKFLKNGELTEHIVNEILQILKEMENLSFSRIDCMLRHIFIDAEGNLKVIDHVNAYKKSRPFPKKLFQGLNKLGKLDAFIDHVKNIDEEMFLKWKNSKTLSKYFK
jgi:predicted Ser/Thr protein kinase